MIQQFAEWSATAGLAETQTLAGARGSVIGIEAAEYLDRITEFKTPKDPSNPGRTGVLPEPLLPALGGVPFGLSRGVREHIATFRKHGITPIFVFSGLDPSSKKSLESGGFGPAELAAGKLSEAWNHYDGNRAPEAVETFRQSGALTAESQFRFLQTLLRAEGVEWVVAPYCASAQLYYMYSKQTIDTIFGNSEILMYNVSEVITDFDFEAESLNWVRKRTCLASLNGISAESFMDAALLCGSSLSPGLPMLDSPNPRNAKPRVKNVADIVMNIGRGSGNSVCLYYLENGRENVTEEYTALFRKAKLTVKHHVVLKENGKAEPLDSEQAPGAVHEFIGQRLPDELYFYFSKGIIGSRILNWRVTGEYLVLPPLDGGESSEYRNLVQKALTDMQMTTMGLLSSSLNTYYQHKNVTKKVWFNKGSPEEINLKSDYDRFKVKGEISSWNVPQSTFGPEFNKHVGSSLFGMCVKSLKDKSFAGKTITRREKNSPPLLSTKDELLANSIWRMLRIRGYTNDKHELTQSGELLCAIVTALPANAQEMALIACELMALKRLNADTLTRYPGVPEHSKDDVRQHMTLISRVACLGAIQHEEIGYTGVLSRNMLAYLAIVEAMRMAVRDMMEVCLTGMLLDGDAERERTDFGELGLFLPFILPQSCILGIAVAYHLTECAKWSDPASQQARAELASDEAEKFKYIVDLPQNFKMAWGIWDAVAKGVKEGAKGAVDEETRKAFGEADGWLRKFR